jgi:LysM repeat protein
MQHDNSEDPWGFWNDEPTRQLKRTPAGTRAHGDTRMVPVVRSDRTQPIDRPSRHINPLTARVGLLIGAMLLLVPISIGLRDDTPPVVRAADSHVVDPISVAKAPPAPAPTEATLAPDTAAPTTIVATTVVPVTPAPTEAPVATAAPTEPPTEPPTTVTKPKKKAAPKTTAVPAPPAPAAVTQTASKTVCASNYTVVKGDAWSTIATRAKVAMKDLLAANGATIKTVLLPGKNICLPTGALAPGPPSTNPPPATTQPKPAATAPLPTTPPATSVPPTTQPPAPANAYTKAQAAQIIRDVWPDDLEDEAIRIATRESNLIPTVRNYCCYGLFQIYYIAHQPWLEGIGVTNAAQLYDPRVNATAALALYNRSGWAPWATTPTTVPTSVSV